MARARVRYTGEKPFKTSAGRWMYTGDDISADPDDIEILFKRHKRANFIVLRDPDGLLGDPVKPTIGDAGPLMAHARKKAGKTAPPKKEKPKGKGGDEE